MQTKVNEAKGQSVDKSLYGHNNTDNDCHFFQLNTGQTKPAGTAHFLEALNPYVSVSCSHETIFKPKWNSS